ncbi:hypothetical protein SK803_06015 [Lentzea sp. BCCO 10_0856]|uniref:CU044_5270 family protein n=1 Tax=Lentzea miocenica TaxID=3095431 RepID=A0ABU4SVE3_9PSEU|nr:hypothetical protein [Lentzea sp. BCCO 10_0856]MDX8029757.1 hypothetical protein [Lentzea sp. BCCO 10_0856]
MEDLMKELAQAAPPAPEVDRDRMERDLVRIIALPRERTARTQFLRRFAPLVAVAAVIALAVVVLPRPTPTVQPGAPAQWWHVLTEQSSLMVVGDPANPYLVQFSSKTDQWLSANRQVTVVQKDGRVEPYSSVDEARWEMAGKPATAPQVGGSRAVRIGPMRPSVQKADVSGFQMSMHSHVRLDSFDSLPTDPAELKKTLENLTGEKTPYRIATLAMGLMASNVRDDQRRAAFELLKMLDGVRFLDRVSLREGSFGVGVAIAAPATFQFSNVETQLVVNPETGLPVVKRDLITTPQHGLPAMWPISEEEYLLLDRTTIDPIVPGDVPVNGEVESPIVER